MQKPETTIKDEEKVERPVMKEAAICGQKKVETTMEKREMQKLDLEKPSQDIESKLNQQGHKTQPRATLSKMEETGKLFNLLRNLTLKFDVMLPK